MRPATGMKRRLTIRSDSTSSRNPNQHVGFGGGGVHFCLGAHVARAQLRAIFGELLRQVPDIQVSDPVYVPVNFIHAIRSMPCTF